MGTMNQVGCMGNCGKMDSTPAMSSQEAYIMNQKRPFISNPIRKMGFYDRIDPTTGRVIFDTTSANSLGVNETLGLKSTVNQSTTQDSTTPKPTGQLVTAWTTGIASVLGSAGSLIGAIKQPTVAQQQEALAQQQALLAQQQQQFGGAVFQQQQPPPQRNNTGLIIGIVVVLLVVGVGVMAFSKN